MNLAEYVAAAQKLIAEHPEYAALPLCEYSERFGYTEITRSPELHEGEYGVFVGRTGVDWKNGRILHI